MEEKAVTLVNLPCGPCTAEQDDGLLKSRGIPYAQAQRFQAPKATPVWTVTRDGTIPAPLCPQLPSRLESVLGPITKGRHFDEDCLYLSVVAPQNAVKAPVMVFLHGGAFISGGGDLECYQPLELARQGIVCVNVTYRLGVFGFLMLPGIAPPNLGFLDQIAALRWVQNNIAGFGGDPSSVTLIGQSAGAESIVCLLASSGTEGLFHRAILMSGPLRDIRERASTGVLLAERAKSILKADPREMSTDELLGLQRAILSNPPHQKHIMLFGPLLGHDPLPSEQELDDRLNARMAQLPLLIGWTTHDGRPFSRAMGPLNSWYSLPFIGGTLESLGTRFITESYFAAPSKALHQRANLQIGGHSTSYCFGWHPPGSALQANHCIDLPLLLGTPGAWEDAPMLCGQRYSNDFQNVAHQVWRLYVDFVWGRRLRAGHISISTNFECSQELWE